VFQRNLAVQMRHAPYSYRCVSYRKKPAAQIAHLFFFQAKVNAVKNKRAILANARPNQQNE